MKKYIPYLSYFYIFFITLSLLFAASAKASEIQLQLPLNELILSQNSAGQTQFSGNNIQYLNTSGEPNLPYQIIKVLLPQDADITSVSAALSNVQISPIAGNWQVEPTPPLAFWDGENLITEWPKKKQIVSGKDTNIYNKNLKFPQNLIGGINAGKLGEWKIAEIPVACFQYNDALKKLYRLNSAQLIISYQPELIMHTQAITLKNNNINHTSSKFGEGRVKNIVINFSEEADSYQSLNTDTNSLKTAYLAAEEELAVNDQSISRYVIMTTTAIQAASLELPNFIASKESRGFLVQVITENDWGGGTGNTAAENIRNWLKNNYIDPAIEQNIEYVLFIGNPHPSTGDVPMKMLWPRQSADTYRESPSDYYYADLTGNWDLDNDGYYGERNDDFGAGGVDRNWEVAVGRIPYYGNINDLDSILAKIITYENEPANQVNWRNQSLLPMKPSDESTPGYHLGEAIKNNFLIPLNKTYHRVYDEDYGLSPVPETTPCTVTNVTNAWTGSQFGSVFWWTHGSTTSASSIMDSSTTTSLDDNYPVFTFQCSCTNSFPESSSNLSYSLLKNGAITTVGATRVSWYYVGQTSFNGSASNAGFTYAYAKGLIYDQVDSGYALHTIKETLYPSSDSIWMNFTVMNIYGDPSLGLLTFGPTSDISKPGTPQGETNPILGGAYTYTTTGAVSTLGHTLEYRFKWRDGTYSDWSTSLSAAKTWNDANPHAVTVEARSQITKDQIVSSDALTVNPGICFINNIYDLQNIQNNLNGIYYLNADIDASETATWNGGLGFDPIGNNSNPFTGTLNGNGCSIYNLKINRPAEDYVGLFGYINDASIENIGLVDASITAHNYTGGLAGYINQTNINNSYVSGTITGYDYSGGLVGYVNYNNIITNSFTEGTIYGHNYSGGLLGYYKGSNLNSCYSQADVSGNNDTGGLIGRGSGGGPIKKSYATGNVSGYDNTGGFIGNSQYMQINDAYATGEVSGHDYVGGFLGYNNAAVANCYSTGAVSATLSCGGFAGYHYGTYNNNFWDYETAGLPQNKDSGDQNNVAGITGETTANMMQQTTFTDWDFTDTWIMAGYPNLKIEYLLRITTLINLPEGCESLTYNQTLNATGGTAPYTWSITAGALPADLTLNASGEISGTPDLGTTNPTPYQVTIQVQDADTNTARKNFYITIVQQEIISEPGTPQGETMPIVGEQYPYSTTGAASNLGHTLEYCFDWNDGTTSSWSTTLSATKIWNDTTLKNISVQVRCQTHTEIGNNSAALLIEPVAEEIITTPGTPTGETSPIIEEQYLYETTGSSSLLGHNLEYRFIWGDGTTSNWSTALTALKIWNQTNIFQITVEARCQTHTNYSQTSAPLTVTPIPIPWIPITTVIDLQDIRLNLNGNYYLENDIDATETATWNNDTGFEPIGSWEEYFTGRFDGKDHAINNLYINRAEYIPVGLFGCTEGAEIKNITLNNININSQNSAGALIGSSNFSTNITNCQLNGGTISANWNGGGLIGENYESNLTSCHVKNINISGANNIGGLIGVNYRGTIKKSSARGNNLAITYDSAGGLIGTNDYNSQVEESYVTDTTITGTNRLGGLCGSTGYSTTISDCYVQSSKVNGTDSLGGLTGTIAQAIVQNSYAVCSVNGESNIGGFIGLIDYGTPTFSANYWNYEETNLLPLQDIGNQGDYPGITSQDTSQMQQKNNFNGWDFSDIWTMTDYPHLNHEYALNGDFNNDALTDAFWATTDGNTGTIYTGLIGAGLETEYTVTPFNINYTARPITDLNNDSYDDLIFKDNLNGNIYLKLLNGLTIIDEGTPADLAGYNLNTSAIENFNWYKDYYLLTKNNSSEIIHLWVTDPQAMPEIPLSLSCTGAIEMMLAEEPTFMDASWEKYTLAKEFTLSAGTGTKTIYAKFKNETDQELDSIPVTIEVETANPEDILNMP